MHTHYKTMRLVTTTGPMDEVQGAFRWLSENVYSSRWSGPMPIGKGKFNTYRYRIISEKRIK